MCRGWNFRYGDNARQKNMYSLRTTPSTLLSDIYHSAPWNFDCHFGSSGILSRENIKCISSRQHTQSQMHTSVLFQLLVSYWINSRLKQSNLIAIGAIKLKLGFYDETVKSIHNDRTCLIISEIFMK